MGYRDHSKILHELQTSKRLRWTLSILSRKPWWGECKQTTTNFINPMFSILFCRRSLPLLSLIASISLVNAKIHQVKVALTPIRALEQEQCIYNINILHAFEEVVVNDGINYQILQPFVAEPLLLATFLSDINQTQDKNVIQKQNQNQNNNHDHNQNQNQKQKAECSCAVTSVSAAHSAQISCDLPPSADLIVTRNETVLDTFEYPLLLVIYSKIGRAHV